MPTTEEFYLARRLIYLRSRVEALEKYHKTTHEDDRANYSDHQRDWVSQELERARDALKAIEAIN